MSEKKKNIPRMSPLAYAIISFVYFLGCWFFFLTDSGKSRGILFIALAGAVLFGTVVGVLTKLTLYSKPTVIGTLSIEKTWEIFSQNQSFTWRFVAYSFASFLLLSIAIFFGLRVARTIGMSTQWGIKFDTGLIILAAGSAFYGCICALFAKKL